MTRWLYNGNFLLWHQHPDVLWVKNIGSRRKKDCLTNIRVQKGDTVVFCDIGKQLVVGIFDVTSTIKEKRNDIFWRIDSYVFDIQQYNRLPEGTFLNLKLLANEISELKELIRNLRRNQSTLYVEIKEEIYQKIGQALSNPLNYRKIKEGTGKEGYTGWLVDPDLLAGLLDYYNSRAVSFASLLVASVFGLITLSAIIQSIFSNYTLDTWIKYIPLGLSVTLYLLFSGAGLYTLKCYSYYTAMADKVKLNGLQTPYFYDLQKITFEDDGKTTNLAEVAYKMEKNHGKSFPKNLVQKKRFLYIILSTTLALLALFIYWQVITKIFGL